MRDGLARELFELCAKFFQQFPSIDSFQVPQLREAGRHCERISGQCSRLVNGTVGRKLIHNFGAPAERADWQSAADYFAKRREVGFDSIDLLCAAPRDAKSSHNLVEDQNRAVPSAFIARDGQEIVGWKIKPRVCRYR